MATTTSPIFVFQTLVPPQQPAATTLDEIKRQEGFQRALFGVKMEDPETGVMCTEWSSRHAALSYAGSSLSRSSSVTNAFVFAGAAEDRGEWRRALSAPCTEVFTAYGAEEGFGGNVARFVGAVRGRVPEGAEGVAFGEGVAEGGGGGTVRMVIGWESREKHLEEKGKADGAIHQNIHELRTLRREVDLFHVAFKEL